MEASLTAVESIIGYRFRERKLLEEALTHSSYTASASYERLELVGDAAIGYAMLTYFFHKYPDLDQGKLSCLRDANVSTEKFARAAVRHGLYNFVRLNATALEEQEAKPVFPFRALAKSYPYTLVFQVSEFVTSVLNEHEPEIYGGLVKAPKILADIVESVAAAVSFDCNYDLKVMWEIFSKLLDPIYTFDMLKKQPHPVTTLYELCQKDGKRVDIKNEIKDDKNIASIYIDGSFVASASYEDKEYAKLQAAKEALKKLTSYEPNNKFSSDVSSLFNGDYGTGAKQRLHELCGKKKWPNPIYKIESEVGRPHEKRFKCSVEIEITEGVFLAKGEEMARLKEAENSAASSMLGGLKGSDFL